MRIDDSIKESTALLSQNKIVTARLDAELLLCHILKKDRSWLIGHADYILDSNNIKLLGEYIQRRSLHEPIAYIRGVQEFYGRNFFIDNTVLVPRPESESIIELFKTLILPASALIADVGCGSGALGVTAVLERPGNQVCFLDIDNTVFKIVKKNIALHDLQNRNCFTGNLLAAHPAKYDVLLCNLPYVPTGHKVNKAAKHEPKIALYSGLDGLDHFRSLLKQLKTGEYGHPVVITESFPEQHPQITKIARAAGWHLSNTLGFAQLFMCL